MRDVSAAYGGNTETVRGISFTVGEGEAVAVLGANGAGKTSLFLAMVGVLLIARGSITVDGVELRPESDTPGGKRQAASIREELRRRVGLVFQNPDDQLFMPRIDDDLAFGPRNLGLDTAEISRRTEAALTALGIPHLRSRSPWRLSGGEKRLAAIAAVLTMEPAVMLLDEPTAFLDPRSRRTLQSALKGLPHTKLIATHDLPFAAELCSGAVLLKDGALRAQGPIEQLLNDTALMEECGLDG
ncbi:MAG: energy-coupling factor ABC transporter ATP-binding protein [Treponema sp.]|nr:energy-coupling factor ABC transporter ATP-binding protein [Treponema sp.]